LVKIEVKRHRDKLIRLGEFSEEDFEDTRDDIFECLKFISEEQIPYEYWHNALPLVRDTDMDDIAFVVLSEYLDARLWTGDKKLRQGLEAMGYNKGILTDELYVLIQNNENPQ
jgi:predicted nucleic acid-binding protein